MARAKKPVEEYSLLSIKIRDHKARVGASINHKANDKRYRHDELRVYQFDSALEIAGICTYPEERSGDRYQVTVYGDRFDEGDLDARLKEFHIKDKDGNPKYRKSRGHHLPVYDIPKGVGYLQKNRVRTVGMAVFGFRIGRSRRCSLCSREMGPFSPSCTNAGSPGIAGSTV